MLQNLKVNFGGALLMRMSVECRALRVLNSYQELSVWTGNDFSPIDSKLLGTFFFFFLHHYNKT